MNMNRFKVSGYLFVCFFCYFVFAALSLPINMEIDHHFNYDAADYIYQNGSIPVITLDEDRIYISPIGTTRSLRPPLTYLVAANVAKLFSFTNIEKAKLFRLGSCLLGALSLVFIFLCLGLLVNPWIAGSVSILTGLMPQFSYLASHSNDDIGAIFSTSFLFFTLAFYYQYKNRLASFILFSSSFGLVILSKFTAWLCLPIIFLYIAFISRFHLIKIYKFYPLFILLFILSGGWWLLFNMYHYGIDDPIAYDFAVKLQEHTSDIPPNQQGYRSQGIGLLQILGNHDEFLSQTFKSFIGYLYWLNYRISNLAYLFYGAIFSSGIVYYLSRFYQFSVHHNHLSRETKDRFFFETLLIIIIIWQFVFYLHHNLVRDIQPQGKYLLPTVIPYLILFCFALESILKKYDYMPLTARFGSKTNIVFCSIFIACLAVLLHLNTVKNYLIPIFKPTTYLTTLKQLKPLDLQSDIKISTTENVTVATSRNSWKLAFNKENASISLQASICELFSSNIVLTVSLEASSSGDFRIYLDENDVGKYRLRYWQPFNKGSSTLIYVIGSKDCSAAKFNITSKAKTLIINQIYMGELKISPYNKPMY